MNSDSSYDILIVGCGPAGIAAALELQKHQPVPRFLIIEARNRVGGRAHTDTTTFVSSTPIDVGARWIHHFRPENLLTAHHTPSDQDYIDDGFHIGSVTTLLDTDGTSVPDVLTQRAEQIVKGWCAKLKQYSPDQEDTSILNAVRDEYEKIEDEQLRRLVALNLAYIEQYEAADLDHLSTKSYSKSDNGVEACDLTLPIGLGTFIAQIAERHHLPVRLNTVVTDIIIPSEASDVIRVMTQNQCVFNAKYVLITIPLGCLKARTIQFHPPLPDWKQKAIDRMGMGLLNKIFIQFPSTFWDEKLESICIASPRFQFFVCAPQEHMLILFVPGTIARQVEQQTDEETVEQVVQSLKPIYPQIPKPTKWLITRWGSDPFAYGSYSNFQVGSTEETVEALARECFGSRVFWAGEHANYRGTIGCVDSAFESGHRTGKRICDKLNAISQ